MALEIVKKCPICDGELFKDFLTCTDFTTSKESFSLVRCATCDFVLTSPKPDEKNIGKYYKSDSYISHTGSGKGLISILYLWVRQYTLRSKVRLLKQYRQTGTVLDYGCGTGNFINKCEQANFTITGLEPDDEARKKSETLNRKAIAKNLNELAKQKFNLITAWHVIEHISDLKDTLQKLSLMLTKNGTIFIAVPNHNSYDAQYYRQYWAGYDVPRHLWHFSAKNMKELLDKVNLEIIEIRPMKLDSFYVSMLSEGYLETEKNQILRFINGLLTGLKSNHKAKKTNNYSSLIYIARLSS